MEKVRDMKTRRVGRRVENRIRKMTKRDLGMCGRRTKQETMKRLTQTRELPCAQLSKNIYTTNTLTRDKSNQEKEG